MPSGVDAGLDAGPRFEVESVDHLSAVVGQAIDITLPAAAGGTGTLRYVLMPEVPGIAFDPDTRALAGTPAVADLYAMTYRVEDEEGSFDELKFAITVEPAGDAGGAPPGSGLVPAPANLAAVSGDRSATLSWGTSEAGIMRHEYRSRTGADYAEVWTPIPNSAPGGVNHAGFTVAGLTNGTTYTFQVRAVSASAASGPSNETTAVPAPGICDRTAQVADAIVAYLDRFGPALGVPVVSDCGDVTGTHLAVIPGLDLTHRTPPLTALKRGDFVGLTLMTGLYLHSNALTALPDGVFAGLSSLEALAVYNNDLTGVTAATFVGLPVLDSLHLQNNAIDTIADGTFAGLPALTSLHLGNNGLTELRRGMFAGLASLEELYLWDNEIPELPADTFADLTALQELDAQSIGLQHLPPGLFSGLASLEYVDLGDNALTGLPAGAFAGLSSLTQLRLWENRLLSLPEGVFAGLSSLQRLYLSDNELTELPARAFEGLASLAVLQMERNAVDSVPLAVALEAAGAMQFKATAPSGAPFDIVLPVRVTNGSIAGGVTTVTISRGQVESAAVSVVRTPGSTGTVSVEIGDLPDPPAAHGGYALVRRATLSL